MKVLVLASEPITADQLRSGLDGSADPSLEDTEIRIVAPALHSSALEFWLSDADEAISKAEAVWRTSVAKLGAEGVDAGGDTGESDPMRAIEDALENFDADRILLFTHPEPEQRYREDLDPAELEQRFGRPVDHVSAPRST
ncbi:MAG TPA: hypothetical protein VG388_07200 [Solirubrobacteraceae bacterium]|nr:hypothetical protein [Solirubrobacteraceae bacterium]